MASADGQELEIVVALQQGQDRQLCSLLAVRQVDSVESWVVPDRLCKLRIRGFSAMGEILENSGLPRTCQAYPAPLWHAS